MKAVLAAGGVIAWAMFPASSWGLEGSAPRGERAFRACAACHSLDSGRNMTGPSLAELWDRKAGTVADFARYSSALKSSGVTWNDETLDKWIADPQHLVPGNQMTFPGIKDAQTRADLLAFLKQATRHGAPSVAQHGGMMSNAVPNLKEADPDERVESISYCKDTYRVKTADGKTHDFWERNLRFKTDSSGDGPKKGVPAIERAGMMGDRASVIFAAPEEISRFVVSQC
jgi:cytochrome c